MSGCGKSEPYVTNNVQWRDDWEVCPAGSVNPSNLKDFKFDDLKFPCCPADMDVFHDEETGNSYCASE